jgi:MFS family permease
MTQATTSGWTGPSLAVVIAHALLLQVVTFCLRPTISYAALDAGLGPEWLGLFSAAFALPGLALAIPAGRLTDRIGERFIAIVGASLVLLAAAFALLVPSVWALVVATVLFGCGHLLTVVSDQALLANRTTPARRDSVFGAYAFVISAGQGIGAGLLAINAGDGATPDLPLQFALATGCSVAGLACALLLRRSPVLPVTGGIPTRPTGILALMRRPNLMRAVVASSIVVTAVEISLVYFPALGVERGFTAATVSAMLVARAVASMASRLGLGLWIRMLGRQRLMVGSVALCALALASLALPVGAVVAIVLCAVFGFFNGVSQPLTLSWLSEVSPKRERATVMSIRLASVRITQTALPAGVGALGGVLGAGGVLVAVAVLVGAASWMSTVIGDAPRTDPEPDPV